MNCTLWDNLGSFWLAEEYTPNPPLTGQVQADVAIIGGGITGFSSAYHLKQRYPEKHIVLIEGQVVVFGASGRNSGFISQEYHGLNGARRLLPEPLRYVHMNAFLAARGFRL